MKEPGSVAQGAWLVAIDLDGTTIGETEEASPAVVTQLRRIERVGHHLLIATGRSAATTLPVLDRIGVWPEYLVCSNGAVILQRDTAATSGYHRLHAAGFQTAAVLEAIRAHLPEAHIAVEDEAGTYRYTHPFPPATTGAAEDQVIVPFETLLDGRAVRVIAVLPDHDVSEFRVSVERMDLKGVTFSLGWTAWLDIAAEGITKAVAAEKVRAVLDFGRDRVLAVGDGFNDIEFLQWAGQFGRGVAMGHAPKELRAVASEITGTFAEDGLVRVLASL
ncbi:Cof subfamily protein (haloacid dehalogenase superfamily)/HAD superfamily hydrolase (TIGR01484 family) [Antricoccus suffuscus]|uniref:Cof subfamily protein (Haloacid dehalogenase superfamily)/HAD superfamily hydrolase (TIGR01484 family) n=2 Tax=Antricoccus suffuscus TaxID=1629062 RepID=A0A2T0ZTF7_9ACTN|nr:Cof subfamily protein (haloacid dehalogenase superfamily)/HAD superfamily hydrolase (TIGR01484 family) [Antricoccus suffuscus]